VTKPCTGRVEIFFSERPELVEQAQAICSGCSHRVPCAAGALARGESAGVWGGMTIEELRRLVDQTGAPAGPGDGVVRFGRPGLRAVPGMRVP